MTRIIIAVSAAILLLILVVAGATHHQTPSRGFANCDVVYSFQTSEYGQSMGIFQCDRADGVTCYFTSNGGAYCK